jgi:cytochrome oxidase assembly protein ShyY1
MTTSRTSQMLRLALTPRWIAALGVLMVFVVATVLLGRWQWDRTQAILQAERAAAAAPVSVDDVYPDRAPGDVPDEVAARAIGHPVTVTGVYDPSMQAIVTSRSLDDQPGVWVVTGMPRPDGTVSAVVRGWLPSADSPGVQPPTEPVQVSGMLHPDEGFYPDAPVDGDTTVVISSGRLAQMWSAPVLPGFVMLSAQDPATEPAPQPVPPTIQTADVPFPIQNFFYAIQWWIFAAFGVVLYLRWLWIETGRSEESEARSRESVI